MLEEQSKRTEGKDYAMEEDPWKREGRGRTLRGVREWRWKGVSLMVTVGLDLVPAGSRDSIGGI